MLIYRLYTEYKIIISQQIWIHIYCHGVGVGMGGGGGHIHVEEEGLETEVDTGGRVVPVEQRTVSRHHRRLGSFVCGRRRFGEIVCGHHRLRSCVSGLCGLPDRSGLCGLTEVFFCPITLLKVIFFCFSFQPFPTLNFFSIKPIVVIICYEYYSG